MLLHLRWRAAPVLLPLATLAILPAVLIWAVAAAQSVGLGRPLDQLPTPAGAATRLDRLILLGTFWALSLGGPLAAFAFGLLALVDADVRVESWEVSARLRLPAPPWNRSQALAVLFLGVGALLFGAMAGHLVADCLLGGDCLSR